MNRSSSEQLFFIATLRFGGNNHRTLFFPSYAQMCATLEAINLAQGLLGRLDQYEFVQLLPCANPISEYARVRQKVTGMGYDMKIFAKHGGKQEHLDRQIDTLCLLS